MNLIKKNNLGHRKTKYIKNSNNSSISNKITKILTGIMQKIGKKMIIKYKKQKKKKKRKTLKNWINKIRVNFQN